MYDQDPPAVWRIDDHLAIGLRTDVVVGKSQTLSLVRGHNRVSLGKRSWLATRCVDNLAAGQRTKPDLLRDTETMGGSDAARSHASIIAKCERNGFVHYARRLGDGLGYLYVPVRQCGGGRRIRPDEKFTLSKFAFLRNVPGEAQRLECYKTNCGYLLLEGWPWAALIGALATPQTLENCQALPLGLTDEEIRTFLQVLFTLSFIVIIDADGANPETRDKALDQWEFHDLTMHALSRSGRTDSPIGGTYRFEDKHAPPAQIKPVPDHIAVIDLPPPGYREGTTPLRDLLSNRVSERMDETEPLTLAQISAFLFWSSGVKREATHPLCNRHYPSAGGLYELELYILIRRADDLEAGVYYYAPHANRLYFLRAYDQSCDRSINRAFVASGRKSLPDSLVIIASRFGKLSFKYQSIAYSLTLKNAGVLYNNMYLVATDLGLSPCGLGSGDSDHFADLTGLDYLEEGAVGEFRLSGKPGRSETPS